MVRAHDCEDVAPELAGRVASYRAGYLAEDRRKLERALADGDLRGLASTNALELGVDIAGLDAVVLAGFPGTVTSFWQQAGRSGRRGQGALILLIARDDPLDTYLVHHPEALLDKPIERVVIDPGNPYVLGPQLLCAATELPLTDAEVRAWNAEAVAETLVDDGLLRRRPSGYFPSPGVDPHPAVDIRGSSGGQIAILETETGRLLGSADVGRAPATVHPGAVYLHQGESVRGRLARLRGRRRVRARRRPRLHDVRTGAHRDRRDRTRRTKHVRAGHHWPGSGVGQQHGHRLPAPRARRRGDRFRRARDADPHPGDQGGDVHDHPGSVAGQRCRTATNSGLAARRRARGDRPAARWSPVATAATSAGLSTAVGPVAGLPTIFVYDGYPGGAGFADRGFQQITAWWGATAAAIEACECPLRLSRPVCSHRNAATETIRWTRRALFGCCVSYCANLQRRRNEEHGDGRPLDGRPRGPAIDGAGSGTPST